MRVRALGVGPGGVRVLPGAVAPSAVIVFPGCNDHGVMRMIPHRRRTRRVRMADHLTGAVAADDLRLLAVQRGLAATEARQVEGGRAVARAVGCADGIEQIQVLRAGHRRPIAQEHSCRWVR